MPVKFSAYTVLRRAIIIVIVFTCGWFAKDRLERPAAPPVAIQVSEPYVIAQRLGEGDFTRNRSLIAGVQAIDAVNLRPQAAGTVADLEVVYPAGPGAPIFEHLRRTGIKVRVLFPGEHG